MTTVRQLLSSDRSGWRIAGKGGFAATDDGVIEVHGGPGLLWYSRESFADFVLRIEWRATGPQDNSGVFLRCPDLQDDPRPAIDRGYEVQIDDRAYDPKTAATGSPLHRTGAVYQLAPALHLLSRPAGQWNAFEITARGPAIAVMLNGQEASRLENGSRQSRGYVALQTHHDGSAVQFRNLTVAPLG
jgi:hypothetical protein